MIDLNFYSTILSVLALLLFITTFICFLLFLFSENMKKEFIKIDYILYLKSVGFISCFSTISVLIYQFYFLTPVCEMCWWQRTFMFPIDIIIFWAIFFKAKKVQFLTLFFSGVGTVIAIYHYYLHFQTFILHKKIETSCSVVGLTPACSESSVLVFGFITIPFMAMIAFLSIFLISIFMIKNEKDILKN